MVVSSWPSTVRIPGDGDQRFPNDLRLLARLFRRWPITVTSKRFVPAARIEAETKPMPEIAADEEFTEIGTGMPATMKAI